MSERFQFWKKQIESAKSACKKYFNKAQDCEKEYTADGKNYNIFYSNVQTLDANLCINNPKPDIQRRFLKKMDSDQLKSNTYAEVARILSGAVEYVVDVAHADTIIKKDVHNVNVVGRGVAWIEYNPTIEVDESGMEYIADRDVHLDSLKYDEYLCSSAESEYDVWWKARRHLLSRKDIYERFGYSAYDRELQYKPDDDNETVLNRGEVWEIWDKNDRKRIFILLTHKNHELLEETDDPYHLESFFPCDELCFIRENNSIIPVPEYMLYRKQADLLEMTAKKIAQISDAIKYVVVSGSQDKSVSNQIVAARNGDVLTIQSNGAVNSIAEMLTVVPVDAAVNMINYLEDLKERTKQSIFDITGISDLMRGMSDPRETAKAQQIKGLFGSLRFQDKQKMVQEHRKRIYRIIAEIIAEHYDEATLSEMTCTYLPTNEEKMALEAKIQSSQLNGQDVPQDLIDKYNGMVNMPTWDDVINILRSDRLRNYTVDVETTATVFDDNEQQTEAINQITQTYLAMTQAAAQLNSPELVKGFMPIMRMNLTNCKVSSAIQRQLDEALDGAYREMDSKAKQPPQPTPEQQKLQADMQLETARLQTDKEKYAMDQQVELKRLDIEHTKVLNETKYKEAEIAIKQQEADRKDAELYAQVQLEQEKLEADTSEEVNVSGDVKDLV